MFSISLTEQFIVIVEMMPRNGWQLKVPVKCWCLVMMNWMIYIDYYQVFYIWEIWNFKVKSFDLF